MIDAPKIVCVGCALNEPHYPCLLTAIRWSDSANASLPAIPFDDDRDVTDAERLTEIEIYIHGR